MSRRFGRDIARTLLATIGVVAAAVVIFGGTGAGSSMTLGCSADLRDLYSCDAIRHATCKKAKDCGAVADADTCYQDYLDAIAAADAVSATKVDRAKCLDTVDDRHKCISDINDLTCDNKTNKIDSCGSGFTFNPVAGAPPPIDGGRPDANTNTDSSVVVPPPTTSTEKLLTSEAFAVDAIASDGSNVYWVTAKGDLRQASLSGGAASTLRAGVSPPLEAAAGNVYFTAAAQFVRMTVSTRVVQVLGPVPTAVAVSSSGSVVVARIATSIVSFSPTQQTIQSGQQVFAGPGLTASGRAYWAVKEPTPTAIYYWDGSGVVGSPAVRSFAFTGSPPVAFFGSVWLDQVGTLYDAQGGGGSTVPSPIVSVMSVEPAGTDGSALWAVKNGDQLVKFDLSSGVTSTVLTASQTIGSISVREGRATVWASTGSAPGIYTIQ